MLYNVYDLDDQYMGQVEVDSAVEAWEVAKKKYQTADRFVLDVRFAEFNTTLGVLHKLCLQDNYSKEKYKVVEVNVIRGETWYRIRHIPTGRLETIPAGYIPHSYSAIECPPIALAPPPDIRVGDYVQWKGTRGIVKRINPSGEVEVETEKEILGVKGIAYPDIYELEKV